MIELKPLQGQVKNLVEDLRGQVASDEKLNAELRAEYQDARAAQRTGGTFETWLDDVLDQAAVAWVLGCVFVRFCEDNRLVDGLWIGGPEDAAPVEKAVAERQAYLIANPRNNDRHWLREAFSYLRQLGATGRIFDQHNPVWRFDISGQAAEELSDFFRRGAGLASLRSEGLNTRFLGDLYQDLSAHAKKVYALLQTPEFVEEFILDRTFEPALKECGLAAMKVIDPTCGSGHFLLGAFARLIRLWKEREPASDIRVLTQRALDQVTGVDINPFAVAIARFRLMIAALNACGLSSLEKAPSFDMRVAAGDSLLEWGDKSSHQGDLLAGLDGRPEFAFYSEDGELLAEYLRPHTYSAVVGNPPYIAVKDKVLNKRYRVLYPACSGKYSLTIPFAQRFFNLAKRGDHDGLGAGHVGQITANSFMKRQFGKKLVNEFLANRTELTEIVDTSGAYIPGHGTPTVILIGLNRAPSERYTLKIRAVLGIDGEPGTPDDPSQGIVWRAIIENIDSAEPDDTWVTVTDIERHLLLSHPVSIAGGGAAEVMETLTKGEKTLETVGAKCSIYSYTGDDEVFIAETPLPRAWIRTNPECRKYSVGEDIRDWQIDTRTILWPYQGRVPQVDLQDTEAFWPHRARLRTGLMFGRTREQRGLPWNVLNLVSWSAVGAEILLCFADVATHNNFSLCRGDIAFNQHAPIIRLAKLSKHDNYVEFLSLLNSSTACFWLKQVSHNKGSTVDQKGARQTTVAWENFYEFTGTKLQEFPLPSDYPLRRGDRLEGLAQQLAGATAPMVVASGVPSQAHLATAATLWKSIRSLMIAIQEELDWEVYRLYDLLDEDLTIQDPPELALGERAFEIVMARKMAAGGLETQWFARHNSTPITELPAHWSPEYRALVEKRIAIIESDRNVALIERPECKRRWATEGWDAMQTRALRDWLLDRLESATLWGGAPNPLSIPQLADKVRHDEDFRSVLDLWVGHDQHDLVKTLAKLIADEHVPYLPALRYKATGLRKRVQWERTWELQREEDEGKTVDIPLPPKYTSADFLKTSYWRNRGKLDVPKERFISYPKAGRDGGDVFSWAGWDHLAQAQALATAYLDRKTNAAWPPGQLLPLLAGIAELEPWLHQWYAEPRPGFPGSPADFFTGLVDTELSALAADRATLTKLRGLEGRA